MIAFTLCSNNYLAQAKTLGDSFVRHNPAGHFVIGLVDRRREDVDYAALGPFEILPVEDLRYSRLRWFLEALHRHGAQHSGQALLHRVPAQ